MNRLYGHSFWGPRSISQGTRRSAAGAGAGADRAGLRSARPGGGADSAEIGLGGQVCVGCKRPAHVGSDAAEAPPTGDGDGQRTQFRRCLTQGFCVQRSYGAGTPELLRHLFAVRERTLAG